MEEILLEICFRKEIVHFKGLGLYMATRMCVYVCAQMHRYFVKGGNIQVWVHVCF